MPTKDNFCSIKGKFGKRVLLERNLGNNCLMLWGRHIEPESIQEIVNWIDQQWGIRSSYVQGSAPIIPPLCKCSTWARGGEIVSQDNGHHPKCEQFVGYIHKKEGTCNQEA